jgi:hypothetical protein
MMTNRIPNACFAKYYNIIRVNIGNYSITIRKIYINAIRVSRVSTYTYAYLVEFQNLSQNVQ